MSSYTFENMSRIGNDTCYTSQYTIQNQGYCNYLLQNYNIGDCYMNDPISLATSQPGVNYKGSFQVGCGGCNVDFNSKLLLDSQLTHDKNKISLTPRLFATVPYLGRGYADAVTESKIQQGLYTDNRKSTIGNSEICYMPYSQTPLLGNISDRVTNPSYCVEGVASEDWIRGGMSSRDMTRDLTVNH